MTTNDSLSESTKQRPVTPDEYNGDETLGIDNTANRLTALRVVLVPVVVWCLSEDTALRNLLAAIFFGIAGITDYFDGYYARQNKSITIMGQLMDPLADKFLVVSSIIMLQELDRLHPWVVIVLICREFAITGLRAVASAEGIVIPASPMAKWKTATQMAGIPMVMLKDALFGIPLLLPGQVLIYGSLLLSLWSLKDYVVDFLKNLAENRRARREAKRAARMARKNKKKAHRIRKFLKKNPELSKDLREALDHPGDGESES
jgi:CDP-diacylglycerol--glycerol-3-phosphate 3-phosphatidyltransferase